MKQKFIYLVMMLFSAIAMQADIADYTITKVITCPEVAYERNWYINFRKLSVTFTSVQGSEQSSDLYMEITPVETEYLGPVTCRMTRPAISAGGTVTKTFNFTEVFDIGNFIKGMHYTLMLYKGEPQSAPYDFTRMTKLDSLTVSFSDSVMVEVADGCTFDTFSCSDCVDFRDSFKIDLIAAYTVDYDSSNPSVVHLKRHRNILPANTGVVVYAPTSTKFQVLDTVADADGVTVDPANKMVAVTSDIVDPNTNEFFNYYVKEDAFEAITSSMELPKGKAYLSILRDPGSQRNAKPLDLGFYSDGVMSVEADCQSVPLFGKGAVYNLRGQKVKTLTPGQIYVIDGRKVYVE